MSDTYESPQLEDPSTITVAILAQGAGDPPSLAISSNSTLLTQLSGISGNWHLEHHELHIELCYEI